MGFAISFLVFLQDQAGFSVDVCWLISTAMEREARRFYLVCLRVCAAGLRFGFLASMFEVEVISIRKIFGICTVGRATAENVVFFGLSSPKMARNEEIKRLLTECGFDLAFLIQQDS
jgi:hypothetical protein